MPEGDTDRQTDRQTEARGGGRERETGETDSRKSKVRRQRVAQATDDTDEHTDRRTH